MRKIAIAALAAAGIAVAAPASAEGFYFGAGPGGVGVGVGVGGPGYYGGGYYGHRAYYDDDYRWGGGYRSYAYEPGYARCRTRVIRNEFGEVRRVRRCW